MKTQSILVSLFLVAGVGCGDNNGSKGGNHDMAMDNGGGDGGDTVDMTPPGDLADTTATPAPTATHVSATGPTAGLVTLGADLSAYLLNPSTAATPVTGELHVVTKDGVDKKIDTAVPLAGYSLGPDGKSIFYTKVAGQSAALFMADPTAATITPKTIFATGVQSTQMPFAGFYTPSGNYFLAGTLPANVAATPDLHVIDAHTGTDVYDRLNGGFAYLELILPDDTMIFQDTAGGTSTGTPPVQTLYWVSLKNAAAAPAATITTRTSQINLTGDNKTLVILKTNGDLLTWDTAAKTGTGTKIASGVAAMTMGFEPTGPIAYIGADKSVHLLGTDGTAMLDLAGTTATADVFGPIAIAPDDGDVYYFRNVDTQNNRGSLVRVQAKSGAAPAAVGDNISIRDLQVTDSAIVFLQNVDDKGQFGDAAKAARDGSGITALGMKANVGGLRVVNPGPDTWFAMQLTAAVDDSANNSTIDGSPAMYGALAWYDYTGGAAVALDAKVHAGTFSFALDDGRTAAFVSGATFNATAGNYVGALKRIAARAPSMTVDGMLSGVSELGPIVGRALFVNAPTATTAGVYYVKY
ncbi:MAG TPA: hypothetical protein VN947_31480 [Polyangia bacterium]|nr:hypothetical protein [Polyangia bacterium]